MSDLVLIFGLTYSYRMAIPEYLGRFALLGVRSKVCVHRFPRGLRHFLNALSGRAFYIVAYRRFWWEERSLKFAAGSICRNIIIIFFIILIPM